MTHHFQRGTLIALGVALAYFPFTIVARLSVPRHSRPQAIDRPLNAENAFKGIRRGLHLVMVTNSDMDDPKGDGSLYYKGEYEHGNPIGSWWYQKNGTALSHCAP